MEFRVLEYFLAVARERSISAAAQSLHLSQPTLSRQLHDLEEELGKPLFIRGSRRITLTEDGVILRKRAQEITELMRKTQKEISASDQSISGDIYIGTGESEGVRQLIRAGMELRKLYPDVHLHTVSGDSADIMERLDKGLFDFAVIWESPDPSAYESLSLGYRDYAVVLMPADSPLAPKEFITMEDLKDIPLIVSRRQLQQNIFSTALNPGGVPLNIAGTYNLIFNATLMVQEGLGYAIGFDHIIDTRCNPTLVSRPLRPTVEFEMHLVWKKYQIFSRAAEAYLDKIHEMLSEQEI